MKKTIRRLRLKPGDIVVVKDFHMAKALTNVGVMCGIDFKVPIVIAPEGIKRVNRKYLEKLLDKSA